MTVIAHLLYGKNVLGGVCIRLIPGLEMGSRAPYMLVAFAQVRSRRDVALHVKEEWLAQALASEQRTETCHGVAFCHFQ